MLNKIGVIGGGDIGGVLVSHCRSWAEGCQKASVPLREPGWVKSEAAIARRRAVVQTYQCGQCSTEEYYVRLADALGGLYTEAEVARVHEAWLLEEYPGAAAFVRELNADSRIVTACLSNTNAAHWEQLIPASGDPRFPSCVELQVALASHQLGVSKPDAEAFAIARRRLAVLSEEILFFDDARPNVEAARHAGWLAEWIDHRLDTVGQLRRFVARYLNGA